MTTQPIGPGQMRVGDADRERMAERLQRAHAAGQLQLDEFDDRVRLAYQARVRSDLDALVADLPSEHSDHRRGTWLTDDEAQPSAYTWPGATTQPEGRTRGSADRTSGSLQERSSNDRHGSWTYAPWMNSLPPQWRGGPAHWRGGQAQSAGGQSPSRSGGVMRSVWMTLAVLIGLWLLVGPVIGFLFNVAFTALIIAGIVTLVGKFRDRR